MWNTNGQVKELQLSYYLILLSTDSKTQVTRHLHLLDPTHYIYATCVHLFRHGTGVEIIDIEQVSPEHCPAISLARGIVKVPHERATYHMQEDCCVEHHHEHVGWGQSDEKIGLCGILRAWISNNIHI